MGSSISLTLWAFLGMESAAQNSDAVENPKRDVPLACMFGTLGAAVIYILSTTVIQGIVPNAELAKSTGPFGLAYAQMFNPTVGSIIMGLAVLACLGSLLGWQFTIAQTGKSAADERMFPAFFAKVNRMGAPITGMIVLGVVQTLLALSTISPSLSEQFSALVNLAVVTNVVPYIIALSALIVMMKTAQGRRRATYRRNVVIALVAMLYSVYALYASGKDAVHGRHAGDGHRLHHLGLHRAPLRTATARRVRAGVTMATAPSKGEGHALQDRTLRGIASARGLTLRGSAPTPAAAGARTGHHAGADQETGQIKLGYRTDARPFSFQDESGKPAGYSVALCQKVAERRQGRAGPGRTSTSSGCRSRSTNRFSAVQQGKVDLLCGADTRDPGAGARMSLLDPDLPGRHRRAAARRRSRPAARGAERTKPQSEPVWRGHRRRSSCRSRRFAVVSGTDARPGWRGKLSDVPAHREGRAGDGYDAGIQGSARPQVERLLRRSRHPAGRGEAQPVGAASSWSLDRYFTYEPLALALARGDEDFRLVVDRALSRLYALRRGQRRSTRSGSASPTTSALTSSTGGVTLPELTSAGTRPGESRQ